MSKRDDRGCNKTLRNKVSSTGPFASPNFVPGQDTKDLVHDMLRVLVVGAGGLGCELRKIAHSIMNTALHCFACLSMSCGVLALGAMPSLSKEALLHALRARLCWESPSLRGHALNSGRGFAIFFAS